MNELCKIKLIEEIRDRVTKEIKAKTSNPRESIYIERITYSSSLDLINKILDEVMLGKSGEEEV